MEIYRIIDNYENYEVSNLGNVKNKKTNIILKGYPSNGYIKVNLYKDSKMTKFHLHRLVAITFIDNIDDKVCVDHIDGNTCNNNVNNLRWATNSENAMNCKISRNNTSGCKGVMFNKERQKWCASITIDYIKIHLGPFNTFDEAKNARQICANQAFGNFVNTCEKI